MLSHTFLYPARMDGFPDGDLDEFFETFESIPSSPSSDCDADDPCFHSGKFQATMIAAQSSSFSKYDVWTDNSCSVFERRQRLFIQMGLRLGQQSHDNAAASLVDTFPSDAKSAEALLGSSLQRERSDLADPVRDTRDPCSQDRPIDLITCNGRGAQVSPRNLVTSETMQGTSEGHAVNCLPKLPTGDGMIADKKVYLNNSREFTEASTLDHSILESSQSIVQECALHKLQGISEDGKVANGRSQQKTVEMSSRDRDLKDGNEFLVNEIRKDDAFNISNGKEVKELSHGKKTTNVEFRKTPSLCSIEQEVSKKVDATYTSHIIDQTDIVNNSEKKRRTWFHAITGFVRGSREKGHHKSGSDERTSSVESSARRQSTDCTDKDKTGKRIKVHAHKKSAKEFADLHLQQQFQAHDGPIRVMKFSLDGRFLATGGCDRVVKLWEVDQNGDWSPEDSSKSYINHTSKFGPLDNNFGDSLHPLFRSEIPKFDLSGHTEDILDLAWSPSQLLLSSSMDKTVRLWNVRNGKCLKVFYHNDYVTCIHFNPVNDGYFISGSLDKKVRIWSIKERQVVDWVDVNEIVTAACYMPDGQGAVVGSDQGICRFYKKSEDGKLQLDLAFEALKRNSRSQVTSISSIQFMPGHISKVMLTSSDSRLRIYDGHIATSKYKGFRNTKGNISASFSSDGMYIICASEDSRVCIWKYYDTNVEHLSQPRKTLSGSYEDFSVRDVTVAIMMPRVCLKSAQIEKNVDELLVIKTDVKTSEAICGNYSSLHVDKAADGIVSDADPFGFGVQNIRDANSCNGNLILDRFLEDCSKLSKDTPDHETGSHKFSSLGTESTWPDDSLAGGQHVANQPELECVVEQPDRNSIPTHGFVIVTAGSKGLIQIFQNCYMNS